MWRLEKQGSSEIVGYKSQSDLPDYYFVGYSYSDANDCELSESKGHPLEVLYKQCTKSSVSSFSVKAEIKDKKITLTNYKTEDCTGAADTTTEPKVFELEKCIHIDGSNRMFSEGAFEVFAFLGLFIVFLF
ncbi:hypothetical protein EIN_160410 [Entamoeba invadens IP1]|uniref:Uncharacterized protein n=1 Tax=Entamoeba invadens IP1 TaxID=370355 RepID=A0A0A1U1P9_ENTIV|nr:hypothetical protein EIN_160410 [Entamoeba invadens IP1]ELP86537.1 hypothetical protein EIN_160410 [Entamoeba invadens IP1]|eukprot:XP_004185883.1 hypothetical protein EIN_160410 [Entamoeba invadens IP1]